MARVSTHILDTASGRPAAGVPVTLERAAEDGWELVARGETDRDGRLVAAGDASSGRHRITFAVGSLSEFYPEISVVFVVGTDSRYHVPLLLSPFGYSTYRGS